MNTKEKTSSRWRDIHDRQRLEVSNILAKHGISMESEHETKGDYLQFRNSVRRVLNSLTAETSLLIDKGDGKAADQNMGLIDSLSSLLNFTQERIDLLEFANTFDTGPSGTAWSRGGSKIPVLNGHQKLSDADPAQRSNFEFGDYIKAMVLGTNSPEIRNALSEGTDSAGGFSVPRYLLNQVIDQMRARTVSIQAGALTIPLDGMTNTIVRVASSPTAGWRVENAAVAESEPTFEGVVLQPRSLAVLVKVSRELLDDSLNIQDALMQAFAGSLATELDRVSLFGSGTAPEPRGIFNTAAINSVSMGTNGAALTNYGKLLDCLYELELDNAAAPTAMIAHPRTRRAIGGFVDTTGQPLMPPPDLASIKRLATTSVPITQTQGTATNASSVIMGDFSQLLIGIRQELRIEILRERFADNLQYAFVAHLRADIALAQPGAFCKLIGIIP